MVLSSNQEFYISTASESGLDKYNASLGSYYPYQDGSTYARPGFSRYGYENQRPCESIPRNHRDIMLEAERVYCEVGLVRNIIDLITDFTLSGIRVVHSQPSIERYYQNWFARVNGVDRSERFCSNLYKFGNVIIRRRWAVLTKKVKKDIRQAKAADEVSLQGVKAPSRRLPARYLFLNPATVEMMGGELAKFVGPKVVRYGVKMPLSLNNKMGGKDSETQRILQEVPEELRKLNEGGDKFIPLDPDNTLVFHYKKEDWDLWAKPIMYGVFADIKTLEKLKLADLTALDGATDRVRLFTLGDLDNKIMPTSEAFAKLNELLQVNVGAGTRNIVWGPDLKLQEVNTESWRFLGEQKYIPTLSAIYGGLGIPPTLTGTDGAGGTTNNLISLKALIKRLDYGRQKLIDFWTEEFELVRQAMGFQKAAILEFDTNNLGDEEAEKKLFIELADRDIIPYESVQRKFGISPEVASDKVELEWKARNKDSRAPKAGPFHNAQFNEQLKKSLLDRGQVTPSEVGLELLPREKGDKTNLIPTTQSGGTQPAKPAKQNGRPVRQKDTVPRKQRRFTPVVKAEEFWAQAAQDKIASLLNPVLTQKFGKKNMRSLTAAETDEAEKIKFAAFFNSEINSEISGESIHLSLQSPFPDVEYNIYKEVAADVAEKLGRDLTFAELHSIQIGVYLDGKV